MWGINRNPKIDIKLYQVINLNLIGEFIVYPHIQTNHLIIY